MLQVQKLDCSLIFEVIERRNGGRVTAALLHPGVQWENSSWLPTSAPGTWLQHSTITLSFRPLGYLIPQRHQLPNSQKLRSTHRVSEVLFFAATNGEKTAEMIETIGTLDPQRPQTGT